MNIVSYLRNEGVRKMRKLLIEKIIRSGSVLGYVITDAETRKEVFQALYIDACLEYIKKAMED